MKEYVEKSSYKREANKHPASRCLIFISCHSRKCDTIVWEIIFYYVSVNNTYVE